jgi:hypothetical protein
MQLHDNFPDTGPVIKIAVNNLLPHAKQEPAIHNRDAKQWAQQRGDHAHRICLAAQGAQARRADLLQPRFHTAIVVSAAVDPGTKSNGAPVPACSAIGSSFEVISMISISAVVET